MYRRGTEAQTRVTGGFRTKRTTKQRAAERRKGAAPLSISGGEAMAPSSSTHIDRHEIMIMNDTITKGEKPLDTVWSLSLESETRARRGSRLACNDKSHVLCTT